MPPFVPAKLDPQIFDPVKKKADIHSQMSKSHSCGTFFQQDLRPKPINLQAAPKQMLKSQSRQLI